MAGDRCIIVMPDKMSQEKETVLRALGAEVIRTPAAAPWDSPQSHFSVARRYRDQLPRGVLLDQYRHPGNPLSHYDVTAAERLAQCGGRVDMLVAAAGTGGTITGLGRRIKERCPGCRVVAVDPVGSVLAGLSAASCPPMISHKFELEGAGAAFSPTVLDRAVVDAWVKTTDEEAFVMVRRLIGEEGLLCGGSSGAAVAAALQAAAPLAAGQRCVVILPDGVRNYMTKFMDDGWLTARGIPLPHTAHET